MDAVDREIMSYLQRDGRMSVTDLARKVRLSVSACHRRVKDLESSGAIRGYHAEIAPEALGLGFEALVMVTMGRTDQATVAAFEKAVAAEPAVISAERLFGETDFILRTLSRDLAGYQELYDTVLGTLPGVERLTSTMVMKRIDTGAPGPRL
ncbi:Lrp/AsnC family transcriptional regulator [Corynebacterium variabile]|uniref:Lrp/AsnC family transcriptional regulator n=1 Tax=Corynebacterium variabile TaxID=1727 RepID=UPI0005A142F1|nr:Lrp/AsnC family transcriptional regulator [Corynebacterium variabile]MDN6239854.1 Lrp/AsnC family transcriptional regulator [Corynebacterium variabile]MDN6476461.1 Lrp/AsnC family transcriptional regulator [Corynebacterium variabile]MDN6660580.1 Lrp/AsnC family transcriptional regulator [Corynebacterium variabile]